MYVDAKKKIGPHATVIVVRRDTGEKIADCFAANTDEGWFDRYERDILTKRIVVDSWRDPLVKHVNDVPFDIVDKVTNQVLASSR